MKLMESQETVSVPICTSSYFCKYTTSGILNIVEADNNNL